MAGLFAESFDRLSIATLSTKFTGYVAGGAHSINPAYGRYGRGLLLTSYVGNNFSFQQLLGVTRSVLWVGCALNPRAASARVVGGFYKDATLRCMFGFNNILQPIVAVSGGGIVAAGTRAANTNEWVYLNIKFTFGGAGACRVDFRMNGEDAGSQAGLTLGADANNFLFGRGSAWIWGGFDVGDIWMDDVYVNDDQGAQANGWLGDRKVFSCRVNAAGSSAQMTPNGAATNHGCVGDDVQDADATYVATAGVGNTDLYGKEALVDAKNIAFAQLNAVLRSDDATARTARLLLKSGAVVEESADLGFTNSYVGKRHILHLDPATGLPFSVGSFNAAEIGQKLTS